MCVFSQQKEEEHTSSHVFSCKDPNPVRRFPLRRTHISLHEFLKPTTSIIPWATRASTLVSENHDALRSSYIWVGVCFIGFKPFGPFNTYMLSVSKAVGSTSTLSHRHGSRCSDLYFPSLLFTYFAHTSQFFLNIQDTLGFCSAIFPAWNNHLWSICLHKLLFPFRSCLLSYPLSETNSNITFNFCSHTPNHFASGPPFLFLKYFPLWIDYIIWPFVLVIHCQISATKWVSTRV